MPAKKPPPKAKPSSFSPVSDIQLNQLKVEWVPRDSVRPNAYNPNKMDWETRQLLLQSLLEDGWTQPIVTLMDGTIVDGEQRWTTSGIDLKPAKVQEIIDKMEERKQQGYPESDSILARLYESKKRLEAGIKGGLPSALSTVTGGLVPITRVDFKDDAHKMISTIRHNSSRGSHKIDAMAGITQDLVKLGLDTKDLVTRLGMDNEQIRRFMAAAAGQAEDMRTALAEQGWSPSVKVVHSAEIMADDDTKNLLERSAEASKESKAYAAEMAKRKLLISKEKEKRVKALAARKGGKAVSQIEKDKIEQELEGEIELPDKPTPPAMSKFLVMITAAEMKTVNEVIGNTWATGLVAMCELFSEHKDWQKSLKARIKKKEQA